MCFTNQNSYERPKFLNIPGYLQPWKKRTMISKKKIESQKTKNKIKSCMLPLTYYISDGIRLQILLRFIAIKLTSLTYFTWIMGQGENYGVTTATAKLPTITRLAVSMPWRRYIMVWTSTGPSYIWSYTRL